MYLHLSKAYM